MRPAPSAPGMAHAPFAPGMAHAPFAPEMRPAPPTSGLRLAPLTLTIQLLLLVLLLLALGPPGSASAAEGASWRFAPALAPAPPPGIEQSPYPVSVGAVGDIEFWAPNRGVLISAGSPGGTPVPMGVYAYNGKNWHQLSTVCGGTDGRIAWAGPDEFWTISDQRAGQVIGNGSSGLLADVSLCHFENGEVVGSYAMPLGQPSSYLPMDAAGCTSPSNCWFAGTLGEYPNSGSFHLHWDGENITTVYDTGPRDDHAVTSMAGYEGGLYEGVGFAGTDEYAPGEAPEEAPIAHTLNPSESNPFSDVFLQGVVDCNGICPTFPNYGGESAEALSGFLLGSDDGLSGDRPAMTQMWAVAGAGEGSNAAEAARPIVLRCGSDSTYESGGEAHDCASDVWEQAPLELLPKGQQIRDVAAEPGSDAAWIALRSSDGRAHVARIAASEPFGPQSIGLGAQDTLGVGGELGADGNRGNASVIACPAPEDCWLATDQGWLYHYSTEADTTLPEDTDANFQKIITNRPPDAGIPALIADVPPPDDSLANQQPPPPPPPQVQASTAYTTEQLVTHMHSHLIHGDTLELSFTLAAEAHVQLLASRHGKLVARTSRKTLRGGKQKLLLPLNPHKWPNKLDLRATPLHPLPRVPVTSGGGSSTTVAPPTSANSVST
jgi:hypothetical protein